MELFTLFLLFAFSVTGLTHIMVDSSIMLVLFRNPVKKYLPFLTGMVNCYQCMGTWCGWVLGALFMVLLHKLSVESLSGWVYGLIVLACGFAGSFLAQVGAYIIAYLEAGSIIDMKKIRTEDEED